MKFHQKTQLSPRKNSLKIAKTQFLDRVEARPSWKTPQKSPDNRKIQVQDYINSVYRLFSALLWLSPATKSVKNLSFTKNTWVFMEAYFVNRAENHCFWPRFCRKLTKTWAFFFRKTWVFLDPEFFQSAQKSLVQWNSNLADWVGQQQKVRYFGVVRYFWTSLCTISSKWSQKKVR